MSNVNGKSWQMVGSILTGDCLRNDHFTVA